MGGRGGGNDILTIILYSKLKLNVSGSIEQLLLKFSLNAFFVVASTYSTSWYSNYGVIIQPYETYKYFCELELVMLTWLGL